MGNLNKVKMVRHKTKVKKQIMTEANIQIKAAHLLQQLQKVDKLGQVKNRFLIQVKNLLLL